MNRHSQDLVPGAATLQEAATWIAEADRILIGAGAGLSAAAGFDYTDEASFAKLFPALREAGFSARYQLIGYPLPPRHQWGFWAVHVADIRLGDEPSPIYQDLRALVGDRDYEVLSSNVDALFTRNGFDPDKVFTPQGDYARYQCLTPCTREVWDARPILARALAEYDPATGQTSEEAVPACPNCGGPVSLNVYAGSWYINDHFLPQLNTLNAWLKDTADNGERLVVIEIGAGFNTPGVVRWPLEGVVEGLPESCLVRINRDHAEVPPSIAARSASVTADASVAVAELAGRA